MRWSLSLAAILLSGCATIEPTGDKVLSVVEVVERHHELDGQAIRVRGYLSLCERMSCWLTPRRSKNSEPYLSIGSSQSFDSSIQNLIGQEIVVEATLDADCLHIQVDPPRPDGTMIVCTDRASVLEDPIFIKAL